MHHITPVEDGRSKSDMAALAYNPSNLMALCISCHVAVHKELGKNSNENQLKHKVQRAIRGYELLLGEIKEDDGRTMETNR